MRFLIGVLTSAFFVAAPAFAQHGTGAAGDMPAMAGKILVMDAWARASAGPARNGAAFFSLRNDGDREDRLVAVETAVAGRAELHTNIYDNGVMRMRQVEGGIAVPGGGQVTLKPGGLHVMMLGLKEKLVEGRRFSLTLTFAKSGSVTVEVPILGIGAMGPGPADHDREHHMPMPGMGPDKDM